MWSVIAGLCGGEEACFSGMSGGAIAYFLIEGCAIAFGCSRRFKD
jgi:hypothetical protein